MTDGAPAQGGFGGRVIQAGDLLVWRQLQSAGAHGGIAMWFTDGSVAQWVTYDQDGQPINSDGNQQAWHYRRVDLSQHAGKTMSLFSMVTESTTAAGAWEIYYQDLALVARDGTVYPIYTREPTVSLTQWSSSGMSGVGYAVDHWVASVPLAAETTTYYHGDPLGSQRLMTTENGYPTWSATYLPFGQEWNPQTTVNHYKFTGQERDAESGLDHMGARQDSSQYGRFVTPDPLGMGAADLTNPQSLNQYAYVGNNPANVIDPGGTDWGDGGDFGGFGGIWGCSDCGGISGGPIFSGPSGPINQCDFLECGYTCPASCYEEPPLPSGEGWNGSPIGGGQMCASISGGNQVCNEGGWMTAGGREVVDTGQYSEQPSGPPSVSPTTVGPGPQDCSADPTVLGDLGCRMNQRATASEELPFVVVGAAAVDAVTGAAIGPLLNEAADAYDGVKTFAGEYPETFNKIQDFLSNAIDVPPTGTLMSETDSLFAIRQLLKQYILH